MSLNRLLLLRILALSFLPATATAADALITPNVGQRLEALGPPLLVAALLLLLSASSTKIRRPMIRTFLWLTGIGVVLYGIFVALHKLSAVAFFLLVLFPFVYPWIVVLVLLFMFGTLLWNTLRESPNVFEPDERSE